MSLNFDPDEINGILYKAGILLENLAKDPQMRVPVAKEDGSPVTEADERVSDFLTKELKKTGFLVVSEEDLPAIPPSEGDSYFLVDPLDGTKYFARGEPEYAICVGLLVDGIPTYGGIYDPINSKLYWAVRGRGAFCEQEKISHKGAADRLVVYSSGFHKKPWKDEVVKVFNIGDIREKGSALKFCDIAKGEVDLYLRFGPTSEWDTAAAQVILEEAGCVLYELKTMKNMEYGKDNYLNRGVIACHKDLLPKALDFVSHRLQGRFPK
jgi:3'(2'), 5'-bisphosphate nucleotidase